MLSDCPIVCVDKQLCPQVQHSLDLRSRPRLPGVTGKPLSNQSEKTFDVGELSASLPDLLVGLVLLKNRLVGLQKSLKLCFPRYPDGVFAQSRAQVFADRSPITKATTCRVRRHSATQSQRLFDRWRT